MNKFFVILVVFFIDFSLAVPPVSQVYLLKGARFKDSNGVSVENPYFSPLAGAIAWNSGLIESLYRYGPPALNLEASKEKGGEKNAVINLVRYLFSAPGEHAAVQVSKTDSSCMINLINEGNWPKIVTHFLAHAPSFDQVLKCIPAKKRSILNSARTYADQKSVAEISFPVETVYMLLSAVWYATVTTLDGRDDIILTPDESLAKTIRGFGSITSMRLYKADFIRELNSDQLIDEARLVLLLFNVMSLDYPPYVEQRSYVCSTSDLSLIPNCVESTLHNIVNALVYDPATRTYDMSFISVDAPIKKFYQMYPVSLDVYSAAAEQKWFNLMEGVGNAHYSLSRGGKCELDGDEQNVVTVLNDRLGLNLPVPTMADIAQKLSSDKQKVTWDDGCKVLVITKQLGGREYELRVHLHLDKWHAEAHFGIRHANVFRDQIIMHDQSYDTLSRLLLDSLMGNDYIVNDKKIDGLSCSWKLLISDTQKVIGNRALDLFRVLASCCGLKDSDRVTAVVEALITQLPYIEEDALVPIARLYLSPVQVHGACAQEFLKNQKRGILARSVGAVAKNLEDVRAIESIIGESLNIGQLLMGVLTAENKDLLDILRDEISKMSVAERSKLLLYEDGADTDVGHQHRYNPLYVTFKLMNQPRLREYAQELVRVLTQDIELKELFKDVPLLGQRLLYASLKVLSHEIIDQLKDFVTGGPSSLRSKILYRALFEKHLSMLGAAVLTPESAPELLGEKYVRALVNVLQARDPDGVFGTLITKETAPEVRKKLGDEFQLVVRTALEKHVAGLDVLFSGLTSDERQVFIQQYLSDIVLRGNEKPALNLIDNLTTQEIKKLLDSNFNHVLQEAISKNMPILVDKLMKDIELDERLELIRNSLFGVVREGNQELALKIIGEMTPQKIREVLGYKLVLVFDVALLKDMRRLVDILLDGITLEERAVIIKNSLPGEIVYGNKETALKIIGEMSPQKIREMLGDKFGLVLDKVLLRNIYELVNILLDDIKPEESAAIIKDALYSVVRAGNEKLAFKIIGEMSQQKIRKVLGDALGTVFGAAFRSNMHKLVEMLLKDITPEERLVIIKDSLYYVVIDSDYEKLALKIIDGIAPQKIRKALGSRFDWVLEGARRTGMTDLLAKLEAGEAAE